MKKIVKPDAALKHLNNLIGTWDIVGRTMDSKVDNVKGRAKIEWILDGNFLQQTGLIEMPDMEVNGIEIVGYDSLTGIFPSLVYGNMGSVAIPYYWQIENNTVTHWTKGSKYIGHFSEDKKTLKGGWRPDEEGKSEGIAYDATMTKRK